MKATVLKCQGTMWFYAPPPIYLVNNTGLDLLAAGDQGDSINSDPAENAGVDSIENKKDIV